MAEEGLNGAQGQQQQGVHYLAQHAASHRVVQHHWHEGYKGEKKGEGEEG